MRTDSWWKETPLTRRWSRERLSAVSNDKFCTAVNSRALQTIYKQHSSVMRQQSGCILKQRSHCGRQMWESCFSLYTLRITYTNRFSDACGLTGLDEHETRQSVTDMSWTWTTRDETRRDVGSPSLITFYTLCSSLQKAALCSWIPVCRPQIHTRTWICIYRPIHTYSPSYTYT